MKRYQLTIKLLSDLCVSDGGVYNSTLDTDICYDSYGFPYIPARRIKGCLRECGLELSDWGMNISVDDLFGKKHEAENRSKVRIGNAYLYDPQLEKGYKTLREEAEQYAENMLFHPQNVLNHYSYIRTQTSIDYNTGVADSTSLRTMRVANKGLMFVADVEMEDADAEKYESAMKACCATFTNMGVGRTRGLGEIQTTLKEPDAKRAESVQEKEMPGHASYVPDAVELHYALTLDEPMICKSTDGGEARSLDYIDGGKILGLIANEINKKDDVDFIDFMNEGELFCSNAYLAKKGERYLEVPASYYSIKNNSHKFVEKRDPEKNPPIPSENECTEEREEKGEPVQLNGMKHCYIRTEQKGTNLSLQKESVRMEERYHHRRPEDKSIGRAVKEDESGDSHFYVMSSMDAGQTFCGYVHGTPEQIRVAYDCLSKLSTVYLGYARSSEYGKTQIRITELKKAQGGYKKIVTDVTDFAVKLESPALLYNDRAFYSTDSTDLDAEIRQILGLAEWKEKDDYTVYKYVSYTTLGGYNVTWNMRKPMVEAFDKGTILYYHLNSPAEITVPECFLIGERISEGLGEASFLELEDLDGKIGDIVKDFAEDEESEDSSEPKVKILKDTLAESLFHDLFLEYVETQAIKEVSEKNDGKSQTKKYNDLKKEEVRPTISNMLLMCQESESIKEIQEKVDERYGEKGGPKEEKRKFANQILKIVEENGQSQNLMDGFADDYGIEIESAPFDLDKYECVYLKALLQQLKYEIRKQTKTKSKGEA